MSAKRVLLANRFAAPTVSLSGPSVTTFARPQAVEAVQNIPPDSKSAAANPCDLSAS